MVGTLKCSLLLAVLVQMEAEATNGSIDQGMDRGRAIIVTSLCYLEMC